MLTPAESKYLSSRAADKVAKNATINAAKIPSTFDMFLMFPSRGRLAHARSLPKSLRITGASPIAPRDAVRPASRIEVAATAYLAVCFVRGAKVVAVRAIGLWRG